MFKSCILKPEIIFFEINKNEISGDMNWSLIKRVTIVKKSVLSLMIYGFNIMEIKIQADLKKWNWCLILKFIGICKESRIAKTTL